MRPITVDLYTAQMSQTYTLLKILISLPGRVAPDLFVGAQLAYKYLKLAQGKLTKSDPGKEHVRPLRGNVIKEANENMH